MPAIQSIEPGYYRIPLPAAVSDSMHGEMAAFELNTLCLRDADGAEGIGYTFTCGRNGGAIDALLARDFPPLLLGEEADRIERIWQKVWWATHYGGRGGPTVLALSALDIALWDLKAKRLREPLWRLLGGFDPSVPCYAGGIDLDDPLDRLLKQTEANLARGFRAIKMKVGRDNLSEDVERVREMNHAIGIPEKIAALERADVPGIARAAMIEAARDYPVPKPMSLAEAEALLARMAA